MYHSFTDNEKLSSELAELKVWRWPEARRGRTTST